MNYVIPAYRIFPIGDTALVIDYGNLVDEPINKEVMARFAQLKNANLPGVVEVVPAYSSLAVYYHPPEVLKKLFNGILPPLIVFICWGSCQGLVIWARWMKKFQ